MKRSAAISVLFILLSCHHALADGSDADWQNNLDYIDTDDISPVLIEHKVDEVVANGIVHQKYNYLNYRFERDGAYILARAYIDDIGSVSLYGPFRIDGEGIVQHAEANGFFELVMNYMKRRYSKMSQLKERDGYELIWPVDENRE